MGQHSKMQFVSLLVYFPSLSPQKTMSSLRVGAWSVLLAALSPLPRRVIVTVFVECVSGHADPKARLPHCLHCVRASLHHHPGCAQAVWRAVLMPVPSQGSGPHPLKKSDQLATTVPTVAAQRTWKSPFDGICVLTRPPVWGHFP